MGKSCGKVIYFNEYDKPEFVTKYVDWKKSQFKSTSLFTKAIIEEETPLGSRHHHPFLSLTELTDNVFNKLDKAGKRSMAQVCKAWAGQYLVGTETSKFDLDYDRQLERENRGNETWVTRNQILVSIYYCKQRKPKAQKRKRRYRRGSSSKYAYVVKSRSEDYYDSDC